MTMTLADIRLLVRRDLCDEDEAVRRWSDDSLDRHIRHALADISAGAPLEAAVLVATSAGSREIDISGIAGMYRVNAVEYPPGWRRRFTCWGEAVRLMDGTLPDGSPALVECYVAYEISDEGSTIPAPLADLLTLGAEGYACLELAGYTVNRINAGGTGTPLDYQRLGEARLAFFRAEITRLGPGGSLRMAELYRE